MTLLTVWEFIDVWHGLNSSSKILIQECCALESHSYNMQWKVQAHVFNWEPLIWQQYRKWFL